MSKEIIHLGPVTSGAKMKLLNNFLCGVQVASLAEGMAWLEHSGLDRDKALQVLKNGAPGSPLLASISARMASEDYTVKLPAASPLQGPRLRARRRGAEWRRAHDCRQRAGAL